MVFKRRDKLSPPQRIRQYVWPKTGWSRAMTYLKHRLHRLPDTPQKISRGVAAGIFTAFTPLFGLHFVVAFVMAKIVRGNVWAAVLATFVGNPLTFVPMGLVSLRMGHFILGSRLSEAEERSFSAAFVSAIDDIRRNLIAIFTEADADWTNVVAFSWDVFLPYLVGGILTGTIAGIAGYYLTLPMVTAYQHTRRQRMKAKQEKRARKAKEKAQKER